MPYGFEDDRSRFDLNELDDVVGTLVPNADMPNVLFSGVRCVLHGTTGLLTGRMTYTKLTPGYEWYRVGTVTGFNVARLAYGSYVLNDSTAMSAGALSMTRANVRVNPGGALWLFAEPAPDDPNFPTTIDGLFNVMFKAAKAGA